jgi:hypothetical protein
MVAPPGLGPPTSTQATTPEASFQTFMNDVTEVLHMIDKLNGFYTPQKGSAFRPCVKRTRTRDDPAIAALLKALQDEHDLAVAMHEHDHAAPTTTSDPTTALAQMPISNDKKKTPTRYTARGSRFRGA